MTVRRSYFSAIAAAAWLVMTVLPARAQDRPVPPPSVVAPPPSVLRPVQPGVMRELVSPRTDAQLARLLPRARTYRVYSFESGEAFDRGRARSWSGVLTMPRPADLGPVTDLRIPLEEGERIDRWHHHADGTWSKVVLNRFGESIGVLSLHDGVARAVIDLDGDGIADFMDALSLDGREIVMASEIEGTAFLDRWLLGENLLCDPGTGRDRPDRPSLLGVAGTLDSCRETRRSRPLVGIALGATAAAPDPLDRACEGRATSRDFAPVGPGPRADDEGMFAGLASWLVGKAVDAAIEGAATARYANAVGVFLAITLEPAPAGEHTETDDADVEFGTSGGENPPGDDDDEEADAVDTPRESPGVDSDGMRGGDPEAALDTVCAMRAQAERRWAVTIEELEEQSTGAADTDCEDPVSDPAAADAKTVPKCGPSRDTQPVTEQIMALLGAYGDRQCGRTEQPGPDGECRGGRTLPDGTGRLWYGFGDVIGLIPCEGTACDPQENP